jgi:hypothetical protein
MVEMDKVVRLLVEVVVLALLEVTGYTLSSTSGLWWRRI